jgi:hypothetical protein
MTDEQRDLENLTKHPGWLLFTEYGKRDVEARVLNATRSAAGEENDIAALNKLRQCIAARDAVESLLQWPENRLQQLAAKAAATTTTPQLSRRGTL